MAYDVSLNSQAIRLADLDRAMTWVRQNGAALGLGANLVAEGLRAERDAMIDAIRRMGTDLSEEATERATRTRTARHQGIASASAA